MDFRIENFPRLASISIHDFLFCAKGSFVERYGDVSGKIRFDGRFGPIDENGCEIGQIEGSSNSEIIFFTCGHSLYWLSKQTLLNPSIPQNATRNRVWKSCRIAHIRLFNDETLLVVYANSSIELCLSRAPNEIRKTLAPLGSLQIMSATSDGNDFSSCRLLVHTYLGSLVLLMPGREDFTPMAYDGSPGMTFDATIVKNLCFSVHDDRSLRVWDLENQTVKTSMTHEYGHMARPFSLSVDERTNTIYTAGNDEKIIRWKWDPKARKLIATGEILMNIGAIRKIVLWRNYLAFSSDSGFLISIDRKAFNFPSTEASIYKGISSTRASCTQRNEVFLIDEKGRLLKNELTEEQFDAKMAVEVFSDPQFKIRYMVSSTGFEAEENKMIIAWGDQIIVDPVATKVLYQCVDKSSRLISVVRWDRLLFASTSDDKILWLPLDEHIPLPNPPHIDLKGTRQGISKKNPFIINCATCFRTGKSTHCLFGCASSQLILVTYDENFEQQGKTVVLEATQYFNRESVQDLWIEEGHLYALAKCGYMLMWTFDVESDNLNLVFLQRVYVGMDWPSRFVQTLDNGILKKFVFGFNSTVAVLFDLSIRMRVWQNDCGGGNRQWNVILHGNFIKMEHIRNEVRHVTTSRIYFPQVLDRPLQIGKILFCEVIPFNDEYYSISAGADNRLVLALHSENGQINTSCERFEAEGFTSISISRTSSTQSLFRLYCGLAKGRLLILNVDLSKKVNANFLMNALTPFCLLDSKQLGVSGRLQVAAESTFQLETGLGFAVGDDCSDQAIYMDSKAEKTKLKIASGDRAGFAKISLCDGFLFGGSTNGNIYVSSAQDEIADLKLSRCGLSALSTFSLTRSSKGAVYAAIGDEAGSIHLVKLNQGDGLQIELVDTLESIHIGTVTAVLLHSVDPMRILSTSLDCRVILLELRDNKLFKLAEMETKVQDPCGITVIAATNERYRVLVYGHGIETMTINIKE